MSKQAAHRSRSGSTDINPLTKSSAGVKDKDKDTPLYAVEIDGLTKSGETTTETKVSSKKEATKHPKKTSFNLSSSGASDSEGDKGDNKGHHHKLLSNPFSSHHKDKGTSNKSPNASPKPSPSASPKLSPREKEDPTKVLQPATSKMMANFALRLDHEALNAALKSDNPKDAAINVIGKSVEKNSNLSPEAKNLIMDGATKVIENVAKDVNSNQPANALHPQHKYLTTFKTHCVQLFLDVEAFFSHLEQGPIGILITHLAAYFATQGAAGSAIHNTNAVKEGRDDKTVIALTDDKKIVSPSPVVPPAAKDEIDPTAKHTGGIIQELHAAIEAAIQKVFKGHMSEDIKQVIKDIATAHFQDARKDLAVVKQEMIEEFKEIFSKDTIRNVVTTVLSEAGKIPPVLVVKSEAGDANSGVIVNVLKPEDNEKAVRSEKITIAGTKVPTEKVEAEKATFVMAEITSHDVTTSTTPPPAVTPLTLPAAMNIATVPGTEEAVPTIGIIPATPTTPDITNTTHLAGEVEVPHTDH